MGNVCIGCKQVFHDGSKMVSTGFGPNDWTMTEIPLELPLCILCKRPHCTACMPNHNCLVLEFKMVVLVRKDLNMSVGKIAAQVGHAVYELQHNIFTTDDGMKFDELDELSDEWYEEGGRIVVLAVNSLDELEHYAQQAEKHGLNIAKYSDAGVTEVAPNTITVLGIGPALASDIDIVTGGLPAL